MVQRWKQSALDDLVTARDNFKLGHYDWSLYMGQLAIEKLLKGLYVKNNNETPPYIHELNKLAERSGLSLDDEQASDFAEISSYHVKARYESIKSVLYKKATAEYSKLWLAKIEEYAAWLISLY